MTRPAALEGWEPWPDDPTFDVPDPDPDLCAFCDDTPATWREPFAGNRCCQDCALRIAERYLT